LSIYIKREEPSRQEAITRAEDVEKIVEKWLRNRYMHKIKQLTITKLWKEGNVWSVDVELEIKSGIFSSKRCTCSLQVDANSGEIVGYK
jgi:hypothetical protein